MKKLAFLTCTFLFREEEGGIPGPLGSPSHIIGGKVSLNSFSVERCKTPQIKT